MDAFRALQIIHISRDTVVNGYPQFHQYVLKYQKGKKAIQKEITMPSKSDILQILGTGSSEFNKNYIDKYQKSRKANTSRNVFHCFIKTLNSTSDKTYGGPPQLVGIYRKPMTAGINFGIIYKRKRYFLGMEVPKECAFDHGEWRNEKFELCSGVTKKKLDCAKDQPDVI